MYDSCRFAKISHCLAANKQCGAKSLSLPLKPLEKTGVLDLCEVDAIVALYPFICNVFSLTTHQVGSLFRNSYYRPEFSIQRKSNRYIPHKNKLRYHIISYNHQGHAQESAKFGNCRTAFCAILMTQSQNSFPRPKKRQTQTSVVLCNQRRGILHHFPSA